MPRVYPPLPGQGSAVYPPLSDASSRVYPALTGAELQKLLWTRRVYPPLQVANSIDRASLTGAYLTRPTSSGPAVSATGTVVAIVTPRAIDTSTGCMIRALKTAKPREPGLIFRLFADRVDCFVVDTNEDVVWAAHTATGVHNSSTITTVWGRWGFIDAKTVEAGEGDSSGVTSTTGSLNIDAGTPDVTNWEMFSAPDVDANRDLNATLQLAVWNRCLSNAEIDAVDAAKDIRAASPTGLILAPWPFVGEGVDVDGSPDVVDLADGFEWTVNGSGDLTGANI